MKKFLLATILILGSLSIFAACGVPTSLANASVPCVSGLSTNAANIYARLWIQGLNNPTDNAGTDSDGIPAVDSTCALNYAEVLFQDNGCGLGWSLDQYALLTDWVTLAYDGCPNTSDGTIRVVLLVYDTTGKYTLQSRRYSEDWANWDAIGTIPADIPRFANDKLSGGVATRTGATTADVTFPAIPAAVYNGSYAGAAPASPVATHYKVYAWQGGSADGPTVNAISNPRWVACGGGTAYPITQTTINGMTIPAQVAGQGIVFSRTLVFEGTELPFVSDSLLGLTGEDGPLAAGVIASSSAHKSGIDTVVNWTSNDETRVTSYQILWAPQGSSDFAVIGNVVNPQGNNHTYTATVRIPSQGSYTVKVGANLTDGTVEYSSPMNISSSVIIQNKARVVPN
jgi:hypothetical protein